MTKNHVFTSTRIQTKRDTAANWETNNPVLLNGEEILVDTNAGEVRKKVGDGTKKYNELPFTDEPIRTLISTKVDKVNGKGLSTNDYTTAEKEKLATIEDSANNYKHPTYTAKESGLYKVTVDTTGHVNAAVAVVKADITALGIPAQDTTYTVATTSANGLMSSVDKIKLDGIEDGAEVNQNAFSNIKVGTSVLAADTKTDTVELVPGSNIQISAADDKITISGSYSVATTSADGLMSSSDKTSLEDLKTRVAYIEQKIQNAIYYA